MPKISRYQIAGVLFLISLISAGCVSLVRQPGPDLKDTSWTLLSYAGEPLLPGTEMTAVFEDHQVRGSASCNQYSGSYRLRGNQLTVENLAWTEMACLDPEGIMEQEQQIMKLFGSAEQAQREDDRLIITTRAEELLIFEKGQ